MRRVLFRCDASPERGLGHVARCHALAQVFGELGWTPGFVIRPRTAEMMSALDVSDVAVHVFEAPTLSEEPDAIGRHLPEAVDLLVVDHYEWDESLERACRPWTKAIAALDDSTGREHDCDYLIDAAATEETYSGKVPSGARVLVGCPYAMVPRRFAGAEPLGAFADRDRTILVSLGATDPVNVTPIALKAIAAADENAQITVVLSSSAPHLDAVRKSAGRNVTLKLDVHDMPALLAAFDLAVGGGGNSALERAAAGLPSVMVLLADNQRGVYDRMVEAGAAIGAGAVNAGLQGRLTDAIGRLLTDPSAMRDLSDRARQLVDGRGPLRVAVVASGAVPLPDGGVVTLRLAERSDNEAILSWQQEPGARLYARVARTPTRDEHERWMTEVLARADRLLTIVVVDGVAVGTLRLDQQQEDPASFEVSLVISQSAQGRGVGRAALALARLMMPRAVLDAEIHPDNAASRAVFSRAGYRTVRDGHYRSLPGAPSHEAVHQKALDG